jgi:hypothetical protein
MGRSASLAELRMRVLAHGEPSPERAEWRDPIRARADGKLQLIWRRALLPL